MEKQIYMDEFDWVSPPDTIVTEAVGSCTGMALFDKVTKQGYLIHVSDPEFGGEMDHFLDLVFQMSDKINLSGKVSGASIFTGDTEEENEHIINIRGIWNH